MATLTVQDVDRDGTAPTFGAADVAGDAYQFVNEAWLHVKNGGAGSINVTLNSQQLCNFGFDHDEVVAVPASGERLIGPIPIRFRDTADGLVKWTYSGVFKL